MTDETEFECTPEDLLTVRASLAPGLPIDAIHCLMSRSQAVIEMLMNQFDEPDDGRRCTDATISNALWSLRGDFDMLEKLIDHGWKTRLTPNKGARHG